MTKKLAPMHPGGVLREEFLTPLELPAGALAKACDLPRTRIERIARRQTKRRALHKEAQEVLRIYPSGAMPIHRRELRGPGGPSPQRLAKKGLEALFPDLFASRIIDQDRRGGRPESASLTVMMPGGIGAQSDAHLARLGFAGIEFIDENGGGPGVRLRKRQRPKKPK